MKVEILFFAALREIAGTEQVTLEVPPSITYAELRNHLGSHYPAMKQLLEVCRIAADTSMVRDSQIVHPSARIALIPPVSGG